jgi:hypothetical protein
MSYDPKNNSDNKPDNTEQQTNYSKNWTNYGPNRPDPRSTNVTPTGNPGFGKAYEPGTSNVRNANVSNTAQNQNNNPYATANSTNTSSVDPYSIQQVQGRGTNKSSLLVKILGALAGFSLLMLGLNYCSSQNKQLNTANVTPTASPTLTVETPEVPAITTPDNSGVTTSPPTTSGPTDGDGTEKIPSDTSSNSPITDNTTNTPVVTPNNNGINNENSTDKTVTKDNSSSVPSTTRGQVNNTQNSEIDLDGTLKNARFKTNTSYYRALAVKARNDIKLYKRWSKYSTPKDQAIYASLEEKQRKLAEIYEALVKK